MEKKLTQQEQAEKDLADKITPLVKELQELEFKRGNGVTLEKNEYIGDRTQEIEKEASKLKSKPE
jgi:molybdopterin-biosynthesis enzyme MoeA-like protein